MTAEKLLMKVDATLASREYAAQILSKSQSLAEEALIMIENNSDISLNALMVFEMIGRHDFKNLESLISRFIYAGKNIEQSSCKRCLAKIFNFAINQHNSELSTYELNSREQSEIINLSFLWLISREKTAVKIFSMQNIFDLREHENWVKQELKAILQKDLPNSSAGYKSRGQKILRKLML